MIKKKLLTMALAVSVIASLAMPVSATELPQEGTEQTSEQTTEQTSEQTSEETTEQTSERTSEETTEQTSEQTSEETTEQTSEQTSEETTEQNFEENTEQKIEDAGIEATENILKAPAIELGKSYTFDCANNHNADIHLPAATAVTSFVKVEVKEAGDYTYMFKSATADRVNFALLDENYNVVSVRKGEKEIKAAGFDLAHQSVTGTYTLAKGTYYISFNIYRFAKTTANGTISIGKAGTVIANPEYDVNEAVVSTSGMTEIEDNMLNAPRIALNTTYTFDCAQNNEAMINLPKEVATNSYVKVLVTEPGSYTYTFKSATADRVNFALLDENYNVVTVRKGERYVDAVAKDLAHESATGTYYLTKGVYYISFNLYRFATTQASGSIWIGKHNHTMKKVVTKATWNKNGAIKNVCEQCNYVSGSTAIYGPKTVTLSSTALVYNGSKQQPTVVVKDTKGNVISSKNYNVVSAEGSKEVGTYVLKVVLKGNYEGSKDISYVINPKGTSVSKLTKKKKSFVVKWKKKANVTGYQIQYAKNANYTKAKTKTFAGTKTASATITKLAGKKKYYVRVRTYVEANGKTYYSAWSKNKTVTTKK